MAWEVGIAPHATACGQKEQIPCVPVALAHVSMNQTGLYSTVIEVNKQITLSQGLSHNSGS